MIIDDDIKQKLTPSAHPGYELLELTKEDLVFEEMKSLQEDENNSKVKPLDKTNRINSFYSVFMVIFQIISIAMSLLMISGAGLGVWWGSTSAFAGIRHTPVGGSIGLGFEIVCIIAAAAASFWTAVTGVPVVWDKSSYVGKMIDIRRLEAKSGKKYFLYEANDKIDFAETLLHSIAIDIDRYYVMANKLLSSLMYYDKSIDKSSNIRAAELCLIKLCPKNVVVLTDEQKQTELSIEMIRKLPISVKIALAKYCIGEAREQFSSDHVYQDKKLDSHHKKLLKKIHVKLNQETTNLSNIEAKINNLTMLFVKILNEFKKAKSKYDLKLNSEQNLEFSTSTLMTNYVHNRRPSPSTNYRNSVDSPKLINDDKEPIPNIFFNHFIQQDSLQINIEDIEEENTPLMRNKTKPTPKNITCRII